MVGNYEGRGPSGWSRTTRNRMRVNHGNGNQKQNKQQKHMKKFTLSFNSSPLLRRLGLGLAGTAAVGVLVFAGSGLFAPTSAQAGPSGDKHADRQVAELDQLLADFHGALSYGGNLTAMMSLWTEDSSLTLNGVAHDGKD